jgi:hypothetical protein
MSHPGVAARGRPDTPATAYRLLPPHLTAEVVAAAVALAAVAWLMTTRDALSMGRMLSGLGMWVRERRTT